MAIQQVQIRAVTVEPCYPDRLAELRAKRRGLRHQMVALHNSLARLQNELASVENELLQHTS